MDDNWFTIEEIDKKTYAISEYGHWEQFHSYLLIGQNEACLIDSGLGIGNIKAECKKLTGQEISVLTTHVHWDHIGGHHHFDKIYVHHDDLEWLRNGIPIPEKSIKESLLKEPFTKPTPSDFDNQNYQCFTGEPTRVLKDGDLVEIGGRNLSILHTPGHSPGHICIFEKSSGYLFTGDLVYSGTLYASFESTDPSAYLSSLQKLSKISGIKKLYPSHNQIPLEHSFIERVTRAFEKIEVEKKLWHGSGTYQFEDFAIQL